MKKRILLFITILALSLVACGKTENAGETNEPAVEAVEVLTNVWNAYDEADKFPVAGGDFSEENMTMDAPGRFGIDAEALENRFGFPQDCVDQIDSVASLTHMMNENTFSAAAFHVVNKDNVSELCKTIQSNIQTKNWVCGFPEKLTIITIDDNYIISVYGEVTLVNTFLKNTEKAYSGEGEVASFSITLY